jgi:hypothetical protein
MASTVTSRPVRARAACRDDDIDIGPRDPRLQEFGNRRDVVTQKGAVGQHMPGAGQAFDERIARRIVLARSRIRHRQYGDANGVEWFGLVDPAG